MLVCGVWRCLWDVWCLNCEEEGQHPPGGLLELSSFAEPSSRGTVEDILARKASLFPANLEPTRARYPNALLVQLAFGISQLSWS